MILVFTTKNSIIDYANSNKYISTYLVEIHKTDRIISHRYIQRGYLRRCYRAFYLILFLHQIINSHENRKHLPSYFPCINC